LRLDRGTVTTTNFETMSGDEIAMAVKGGKIDGFDFETCYDANDRRSVDIICDCCRGVGHVRRQCPSPKQYRSFGYVIKLLELARSRSEQRSKQSRDLAGGKRPPPRGQRLPLRNQPSSFQSAPRGANSAHEVGPREKEKVRGDATRAATERASKTIEADCEFRSMPISLGDYFEDEDFTHSVRLVEEDSVLKVETVESGLRVEEAAVADSTKWSVGVSLLFVLLNLREATKCFLVGSVVFAAAALTGWVIGQMRQVEVHAVNLSNGPIFMTNESEQVLRICVDSGATSGCISSARINLIKITNTSPRAKVKVASGSILPVVAIGDLTLTNLSGFLLESDGSQTPTITQGTWHNMLVVEGLDPDTVLVSVRQMRDLDGIFTYFNSDNEAGISDCLKFPDGVYVPFSNDRFELVGTAPDQRGNHQCLHLNQGGRPAIHIHAALCHPGIQRTKTSNVYIDGHKVMPLPDGLICKGCTLGGLKNILRTGSSQRREMKNTKDHVTFYGQVIYSDTCTSFPRSFPHGFTGMVNFCDAYSGERDFYFVVRPHDPEEVASALKDFHRKNKHKLKEGKIWTWKTDNGGEFRGEAIDGPSGISRELVTKREFSIANTKNCNPEAERAWGVIQRGIRTCHAHAEAPHCLWPWAAAQCSLVYHHLASAVHSPPRSPRDFLNPNLPPADISWARTLFCDVLVALPERDVYNKVCHRTTMGTHLGYDERRRGHFVYCPKERRLGTYKVLKWLEDKFTSCKSVSSDTPVEYHSVDDLQTGPTTASLLPKFIRKGNDNNTLHALSKSVSDTMGSLLIGMPVYAHQHKVIWDGQDQLVWTTEQTPPEMVYAVQGSTSKDTRFPTSVQEATKTPYWPLVKEALEEEIRGKFLDNKAWEVVPRPTDRKVVKSKWVLRFYQDQDGSISRVKARLVACGYSQVEGIDYTEVFAATLSAPNFRIFCCVISALDWNTDQLDAVKAFTQSEVDAEIYVEMPEGFAVEGHVLKLNKALEGIKQGAYLWFKRNSAALISVGFVASLTEPNLYIHSEHPIIIAVFVDDVIVGYDQTATEAYLGIKEKYSQLINIGSKDVNEVHRFIGVDIARDRGKRTISLCQSKYIGELGVRFQGRAVESYSPTGPLRKSVDEFDKLSEGTDSEEKVDVKDYMQLVGSILWVANMTRPDIAYYCSRLAMYCKNPTKRHEYYALCVVGYLLKTKDMSITYGGKLRVPLGMDELPEGYMESLGLHTYHDSSWGRDIQPFGGYVIMLNSGAVHWGARKVRTIPDSTAEAETAVASRASKDTVAVRMVLGDLRIGIQGPTPMLGDCRATRDIIVKPGSTQRTKYFERATLLVKRLFMTRIVVPILIRTDDMVADIFTKALPRDKLAKCRTYMLNEDRNSSSMGALSAKARKIWKHLRSVGLE